MVEETVEETARATEGRPPEEKAVAMAAATD